LALKPFSENSVSSVADKKKKAIATDITEGHRGKPETLKT